MIRAGRRSRQIIRRYSLSVMNTINDEQWSRDRKLDGDYCDMVNGFCGTKQESAGNEV